MSRSDSGGQVRGCGTLTIDPKYKGSTFLSTLQSDAGSSNVAPSDVTIHDFSIPLKPTNTPPQQEDLVQGMHNEALLNATSQDLEDSNSTPEVDMSQIYLQAIGATSQYLEQEQMQAQINEIQHRLLEFQQERERERQEWEKEREQRKQEEERERKKWEWEREQQKRELERVFHEWEWEREQRKREWKEELQQQQQQFIQQQQMMEQLMKQKFTTSICHKPSNPLDTHHPND